MIGKTGLQHDKWLKGDKLMLTLLNRFKILASSLCVVFAGAFSAQAQKAPDSEEERLAKRLANPVAALISMPFQFNYDRILVRQTMANVRPSTSSR